MNKLGIVAGGGELPAICLQNALEKEEEVVLLPILESDFKPIPYKGKIIPIHIGKIQNILKICKKEKIQRILLVGKLKKDLIFHGLKFDWKAVSILAKSFNKNDYPIFSAVAKEFEKYGIQFESQKKYLANCLLPAGRYTKKSISDKEYKDIELGMDYAKKLADWDIGQTVVVLDQTIVAVEAVEGTDETIRRGGILTRGKKGAVVCKSSKSNQDDRFDLPAVGIQTLKIMLEYGCKTLAIREGDTIVVNPKEFISFADKNNLNIISYGNQGKKINQHYQKSFTKI